MSNKVWPFLPSFAKIIILKKSGNTRKILTRLKILYVNRLRESFKNLK